MSGLGMLVISTPAFAASSPSSAEQFIADINALRAQVGVGALSESSALDSIAAGWTVHLESVGTLSHNPNLASSAPSNWLALGENVGVGPDVAALQQAFTNSPEHYANMVDRSYNQIGVAVQIDSNGAMWVTEDYMELPAPAPARAAAPVQTTTPTTAPVVRSTAPAPAPVVRSTASAPVVQAPAPASSSGAAARTTVPVSSQSAPTANPVQATAAAPAASLSPVAPVSSHQSAPPATATTGAGVSTVDHQVPASSSQLRPDPAAATKPSINPWVARTAIPGALLASFVLFITRPRRPRRQAVMA
ncbi:MAG: CAP domain-containing protein [Acidimicrobiales bacterium]